MAIKDLITDLIGDTVDKTSEFIDDIGRYFGIGDDRSTSLSEMLSKGENFLTSGWNETKNIFTSEWNNIENSFANLGQTFWTGGFVGISKSKMEELCQRIESYCQEIENHINSFNETAEIVDTFKGSKLEPAIKNYIVQIKALLYAYVTRMRISAKQAPQFYAQYEINEQKAAQNVENVAQDIKQEAAKVKLD